MLNLHKMLLHKLLRDVLWPSVWIATGLLATVAFFRDMELPGLQSLGIAVAMITGTTTVVLMLPRESITRALIWFGSVLVSAFLIIYDVVDAILDPIVHADWPIAIFAIAMVIGVAAVVLVRVTDEL